MAGLDAADWAELEANNPTYIPNHRAAPHPTAFQGEWLGQPGPGGSIIHEGYLPMDPEDIREMRSMSNTPYDNPLVQHLLRFAETAPERMTDDKEFDRFTFSPPFGQDDYFPQIAPYITPTPPQTAPRQTAPAPQRRRPRQKAASPGRSQLRQVTQASQLPAPDQTAAAAHPAPHTSPAKQGDNRTGYANLLKGRPTFNVRPPLNIDISMVEINVFYPSWLQNPLAVLRAVQNGFPAPELADLQLSVYDDFTADDRVKAVNRVKKQIEKAVQLEWKLPSVGNLAALSTQRGLQPDLTANNWLLRSEYPEAIKDKAVWVDVKLVDIASSVPRAKWPRGEDRLLLTACLEFAVANPAMDLTTAHWDWIIQNQLQGLNLPAPPTGQNVNRDTAALDRLLS